MKKRKWLLILLAPIIIWIGLYVSTHQAAPPALEGVDAWSPTPQAIVASVRNASPSTLEVKRDVFCTEFKKRFRDQQVAVMVRFESPTSFKLLCAAVMPKWDMLRVAYALSTEAEKIFGAKFHVSIYETYISAEMKLVGELTHSLSGQVTADFANGFPRLRPRSERMPSKSDRDMQEIYYLMNDL